MEKFDHKKYRDDLAKDLKNIPDHEERKTVLESEEESIRYRQAKGEHIKDVADFIGAKNLGIDASIKYQKDERQYLQERTAREEEKVKTLERTTQKVESTLAGLEKEKLIQTVEKGQNILVELLDQGFLDKPENVELFLRKVEQRVRKEKTDRDRSTRYTGQGKDPYLVKFEERLSEIEGIRTELTKGEQYTFGTELAKKLLAIVYRGEGRNLTNMSTSTYGAYVYRDAKDLVRKDSNEYGTDDAVKELQQIGEAGDIRGQEKMQDRLMLLSCFSKLFPEMSKAQIEQYEIFLLGKDNKGYLSSGGGQEPRGKRKFEIACEDGRKWKLPKAYEKIYFLGATEESLPITRFAGRAENHSGRYIAVGDYQFETTSGSCAGGAREVGDGIEFGGGNDDHYSMKMFRKAEDAGLLPDVASGIPLFVEQRGNYKTVVLPISQKSPEVVEGYTIPTEDVVEINLTGDPNIKKIQEEEGKKGVNEYISKLIKDRLTEKQK